MIASTVCLTPLLTIGAILIAGSIERMRYHNALHPGPRGQKRNWIRRHLGFEPKYYQRHESIDIVNPECRDPDCRHSTSVAY